MFLSLVVVSLFLGQDVSGFQSSNQVVQMRPSLGSSVSLMSYLEKLATAAPKANYSPFGSKPLSIVKKPSYGVSTGVKPAASNPMGSYLSQMANAVAKQPAVAAPTNPWGASTPARPAAAFPAYGSTPPAASSGSAVKKSYGISSGVKPAASNPMGSYLSQMAGSVKSSPAASAAFPVYGNTMPVASSGSAVKKSYGISSGVKPASSNPMGSYLSQMAGKSASSTPAAAAFPAYGNATPAKPASSGAAVKKNYGISSGVKLPASSSGTSYLSNMASKTAAQATTQLVNSISMMNSHMANVTPQSGSAVKKNYGIGGGKKHVASTSGTSYLTNMSSSKDIAAVAQQAKSSLESNISSMNGYLENIASSSGSAVKRSYGIGGGKKAPSGNLQPSYLDKLTQTELVVLADQASRKFDAIVSETMKGTPQEKIVIELRKITASLEAIVELLEQII